MKEIRPSTWAVLFVLVLLIFGPALLIDFDSFGKIPEAPGPSNHPVAPPPPPKPPPENRGVNRAGDPDNAPAPGNVPAD